MKLALKNSGPSGKRRLTTAPCDHDREAADEQAAPAEDVADEAAEDDGGGRDEGQQQEEVLEVRLAAQGLLCRGQAG